jgi:SRSO17 transposase
MLVVLIAFSWGRRNIATLYRHLDSRNQPHRSRFNNFLSVDRCDYAAVLRLKADELLTLLAPAKGETVELIIDDSKKQKRGKHIEAVGWIKDPLTGKTIRGHQFVTATVCFRGYTIPLGIRLYIKKEDSRVLSHPFKKTTELAAELIREFEAPQGVHVRVLFDSYYLCPVVVKECRKKGFRFVSTLKSNRNLFKNGRKLKAGTHTAKTCFAPKEKNILHSQIQRQCQTTRMSMPAGWRSGKSENCMFYFHARKPIRKSWDL